MFDWLMLTPTEGLVYLRDMCIEYPSSILRFQHYTTDNKGKIQRCDPVAQCFRLDFPSPAEMDAVLSTMDVREFCQAWSQNKVGIGELLEKVNYVLNYREAVPLQLKESHWSSLPQQPLDEPHARAA